MDKARRYRLRIHDPAAWGPGNLKVYEGPLDHLLRAVLLRRFSPATPCWLNTSTGVYVIGDGLADLARVR